MAHTFTLGPITSRVLRVSILGSILVSVYPRPEEGVGKCLRPVRS